MKEKIYDIEVFPNFVCIAVEDPYEDKKEYMYAFNGRWYNRELLRALLFDYYILDFNGHEYDVHILNGMWQFQHDKDFHLKIYKMSQRIVNTPFGEPNPYAYSKPDVLSRSIDLKKVGGINKSLKLTGVSLKHHKLQDLPYPFDTRVNKEQAKNILKYNFVDTAITKKIFHKVLPEIEMRIELSKLYKIHMLSDIKATITAKITKQWILEIDPDFDFSYRNYYKTLHFRDIIEPEIKFKTPIFQQFLYHLKENVEYYEVMNMEDTPKKKWKLDNLLLQVNDKLALQFGFGGIHSVDEPGNFQSNENLIIRDADVNIPASERWQVPSEKLRELRGCSYGRILSQAS